MGNDSKDRVWLITGCSTGLGRDLAKAVISHGYRAAITARNPESIRDIIEAGGDRAIALKLDVTNRDEAESAVAATEKKFGRIDVLVNNAGIGYFAAVEES
ncbi:MAG: SDR family NAD(P)-dependent oxidoreductase, partial [Gemmatimonadaceae bacterium]|nr:SDR family NAD(P)-dependent oxidoreductase [Gemmatimonadaceae bacterium]